GSGFFVRPNMIATNVHVIDQASGGLAKLVGRAKEVPIRGILAMDRRHDLVLLSTTDSAPGLALGADRALDIGDLVYAVGNPQGLEGTFSQRIVSGIRQLATDTLIQLTAPLSPGSSGGPVLTTRGEVVGIAVATIRGGQNLNFMIPVRYLRQ